MERVSAPASAMDVLHRWPLSLSARTTAQIAEAHDIYMQRVMKWMMALTDRGYFTRSIVPITASTGGRSACWTLTPKGLDVARELQTEKA